MLKTLEDRILVLPIDEAKETSRGVILETQTEKQTKGTVIFVGPGRTLENGMRENMDVKEWDIVFFTKYGPDELLYEDKKYFSIKQSSILAIYPIIACEK